MSVQKIPLAFNLMPVNINTTLHMTLGLPQVVVELPHPDKGRPCTYTCSILATPKTRTRRNADDPCGACFVTPFPCLRSEVGLVKVEPFREVKSGNWRQSMFLAKLRHSLRRIYFHDVNVEKVAHGLCNYLNSAGATLSEMSAPSMAFSRHVLVQTP